MTGLRRSAGRVTAAVGAGTALRAELVVAALTYLGLLLTWHALGTAVLRPHARAGDQRLAQDGGPVE